MEDVRGELNKGVTNWNQWRDRNPRVPCQFDKQDLSEGFFFEGNFGGASFKQANLARACLIGANLQNANLQGADLSGAYLSEANLCNADLRKANLTGASLNNANLSGAKLLGTNLTDAATCQTIFPRAVDAEAQVVNQAVRQRSDQANRRMVASQSVTSEPVASEPVASEPVTSEPEETFAVGLANTPDNRQVAYPFVQTPSTDGSDKKVARSSDFEPRSHFVRQRAQPFIWLAIAAGTVSSLIGLSVMLLSFQAAEQAPQEIALDESKAPAQTLSIARTFDSTNQVWALAAHDAANGLSIVAAGNADNQIQVWNRQTGELMRVLTGHRDTIRALAISKSGRHLVSMGGDGLRVWNSETGELLYSIPATGLPVWSVAISPDERFIISGDYDGRIEVRDLDGGKLQYHLQTEATIWSLAAAADGQSFVSGGSDRTIRQWNLVDGRLLQTLPGHSDAVRTVAIGPDSKTVASGSWDNTIKLWDLSSGELKSTISGHSDRVVSVAISPNGQTLASGSKDRTLKLWDISAGQAAPPEETPLIATLDQSEDWILSVAFSTSTEPSDDAKPTLVSGGKQHTVKVWE